MLHSIPWLFVLSIKGPLKVVQKPFKVKAMYLYMKLSTPQGLFAD